MTQNSNGGPRDQGRRRAISLLILRHLHDGDVIDYPIAEDHAHREIVQELEAQGFIARWDRIWPLHDRYRLTEQGIAEIEKVYKPEQYEKDMAALRQQNLSPEDRRRYLRDRGYDPYASTVVHDPYADWNTWDDDDPGVLFGYIFSDRDTRQDWIPEPVIEPPSSPPIVEDLDTAAGSHAPEADHHSLDVS